jgi:Zn-finger nucleic acid-binding protein
MSGQPGGVCPDCGFQMSIVKGALGEQHVEIDVCPKCEAIWYDKDEFETLVPSDGLLQPTVSAGKAYRRDMTIALAADLRSKKLHVNFLSQLKTSMKKVYFVPVPDISLIISNLMSQKVISIDSSTGKIIVNE